MRYIALQSMLIRRFVGKRTIRSWLVAPLPLLWINHWCNSASEAWFSSRAAAIARSRGRDTNVYSSVESCCGSSGPTTGQISAPALRCPCCILDAVFGVNQEKMRRVGAFIPFWKGRKRFSGDFFCLDNTFQWAFYVHIKARRIWIDPVFSSLRR